MPEACKSTGALTAQEVVDLWVKWCIDNDLPPPVIDLTVQALSP